ncbi:MAG: epimerase [Rehaibacterium terrae]|uniref:epimerase n=1 Tax=Rehaibacterium terrae TaxID=1341696 RepID=UPI00391C06AB
MSTTRRDMLKLGALAGAVGLVAKSGLLSAADVPVPRAGKPLRILILGGTGFTGPHQVRYALARGHRITLFNRGRRPQDWPVGVEELTGDRETGDLAALAGREWDVCIDNPTSVPRWVRDVGEVLQGKVGHYIFISTLSVYADSTTPGQDEDAPLARYTGADIMKETRETLRANMALYGPMKAACEAEAEKWFPGITTIIRPGLIVGPGDETDRFSYWPLRIARGGDVLAPGDGSDPTQIIDARDLAEWTIRVAESRTLGKFNAMGPNYAMSMAAMLHGIQAVTTAGARLHWVPVEFLREHDVSPWVDMPAWVPGSGETAGFARHRNDRAIAAGLSFRPLATTAADTLEWFATLPAERQAQLRAGIEPEREAEVLKAWRAQRQG